MADGSIKIDIVGEDKELQKKLKEIEGLEKQKKKIELSLEVNDASMGEAEAKLNRQIDKYWEFMDKKAEIEAKKITMPAMNLGTGEMPEESFYLEKDQIALNKINEKIARQNELMDGIEAKQKALTSAREQDESVLAGINSKLQTASAEADSIKLDGMKQSMDKSSSALSTIGEKIKGVARNVVKWGLAVFGVRSAYTAVRRLMSTLSQYNEQLKTDLSYLGFSIAKVFEPIILRIVDLVYTAMGYIKYILQSWFGINIFANSSASAFQAGNNAMGGMVQGAKELKKQLAGFDEMNRLEEGLDGGSAGGGGIGGMAPSMDLSTLDVPIPEWVDWISKNKDTIMEWVVGILGLLAGFKILSWIANLGNMAKGIKEVSTMTSGLFKNMTLLKGLGIAVAISGIVIAIKKLIDIAPKLWKIAEGGDVDMSAWTDWLGVIKGVGIAIIGLGIASGNPLVALAGLGTIIAGVAGDATYASTEAGRLQRANNDLKTSTDELVEAKWRVHDAENTLTKAVDGQIEAVKRERESLKRLQEAEAESGISGKALQDQVDSGAKSVKELSNEELNLLGLYREHEKANDNVQKSTENVTTATNDLEGAIKLLDDATRKQELTMFKNAAQTLKSKEEFDKFKTSVVKAFDEGKLNGEEAAEAIATAMSVMGSDSKTAIEGLPKAISDNLTEEKLSENNKAVIGWGENLWRSLKSIFSGGIKFDILGQFSTGGGSGAGGGSGGSRNAKGAIYYPRLASGGIINYPNHGVVLGRAIGGESGAEGVIPLTDSQAMAELGQSIGKWITVNNIINTQVGNRTVAREIQRVQNQDLFASNGGLV